MVDDLVPRARPQRAAVSDRHRDEAVDALFRTRCTALVRLAMCLIGDRSAAEEVVQDAFVSLHQHWGLLRADESAGAYLRACVINGCRSRQRRLVRARAFAPRLDATTASLAVEDETLRLDEAARVAAAVRRLPVRQREVVVARYYLGMTEAQTAEMLNIGVGSVKRHAFRALHSLQRRIEVTS